MSASSELGQRFDPYIRVPGASHFLDLAESRSGTVRALLLSRTVEQVESIIAAVKRADVRKLPLVLQGLDLATKGLLTRRIVSMLRAYRSFLNDREHADVREALDTVFRPVGAWVGGQHVITSPALLVVQSILYSHCEWFHEYLWEANSALRAYRELCGAVLGQRAIVSDAHAGFVAAIIAHQTLLRAAWSTGEDDDPPEVYAFYQDPEDPGKRVWADARFSDPDRRQEWADEAVAMALAGTLFQFLPKKDADDDREASIGKRQLAAGLVLHSLCLSCRHGRGEPASISVFKEQALRSFDNLLAPETGRKPRLAYLQYGRYAHSSQSGGRPLGLLQEARSYVLEEGSGDCNFMFVFQRVSSRRVWRDRELNDGVKQPFNWENTSARGEAITGLVQQTIGKAVLFRLHDHVYVNSMLGITEGAGEPTSEILLESLIGKVADEHLNYLPERHRYFPAALVGHVLHAMRDRRPHDFTPAYIIARDVRTALASAHRDEQFILWLPNPDQMDLNHARTIGEVWSPECDDNAAVLVARYVAALMIGIAVSYAPRELLLDFLCDKAGEKWKPLIEAAFRSNGGPLMTAYVEQVRSRRAISAVSGGIDPWSIQASEKDEERWARNAHSPVDVLGIDVGGTAIKASHFRVNPGNKTGQPDWQPGKQQNVKWDFLPPPGHMIPDRARLLLQTVAEAVKADIAAEAVNALGISLAAPVMDAVPVGASKVTGRLLDGGPADIANCNAQKLHKIDFAVAAKGVFPDCESTLVLNDGEADIRASVAGLRASGEGVSVVLKEGTGVAFAVYANGEPVDVIAETAKAVLNLRCEPQDKPEAERFQQGQLSERCSKQKFGTLLSLLGPKEFWKNQLEETKAHLIGGLLELSVAGDSYHKTEPAEIADLWSSQRPELPVGSQLYKILESIYGDKAAGHCIELLRALETILPDWERRWKSSKQQQPCELYRRALSEVQDRAHLDIRSAPTDERTPETDALRALITLKRTYDQLGVSTKAAVCCARVLGCWLADAIALTWEIFGAREVRLAGGPLSGETGIFITLSARKALEDVYGFDLDPAEDVRASNPRPLGGRERAAGHGPREVKTLTLEFPARTRAEGGPKGAALAAFRAYLADLKLKQLLVCRSWVADPEPKPGKTDRPFSSKEVADWVRGGAPEPWLLADAEVADMLARESSALGLTRTSEGNFELWRARPSR